MDAGLSVIACLVLVVMFAAFWPETVNFETACEPDAS